MKTKVVHCKKEKYDVYIGRRKDTPYHFGNPFRLGENESRGTAIEKFEKWLLGLDYQDVEPDRRMWILVNLNSLKGKVLGCWCKPYPCHGDVYVKMVEGDNIYLCRWCDKAFASQYGMFCPHCCRFQD